MFTPVSVVPPDTTKLLPVIDIVSKEIFAENTGVGADNVDSVDTDLTLSVV